MNTRRLSLRAAATTLFLALVTAHSSWASSDMTDAEVRKVDKDAGKLTLRHAEIKSLDMPAMTMVFQVRDRALLDRVKAGDKVKFRAEQSAGAYIVVAIEPTRP